MCRRVGPWDGGWFGRAFRTHAVISHMSMWGDTHYWALAFLPCCCAVSTSTNFSPHGTHGGEQLHRHNTTPQTQGRPRSPSSQTGRTLHVRPTAPPAQAPLSAPHNAHVSTREREWEGTHLPQNLPSAPPPPHTHTHTQHTPARCASHGAAFSQGALVPAWHQTQHRAWQRKEEETHSGIWCEAG